MGCAGEEGAGHVNKADQRLLRAAQEKRKKKKTMIYDSKRANREKSLTDSVGYFTWESRVC